MDRFGETFGTDASLAGGGSSRWWPWSAMPLPLWCRLEAFAVSTLVVAVAEIGDKTQLLALLLATRYRAPWQIIAGVTLATIANHALAGVVGRLVADLLDPETLRWLLAVSFAAMAAWALIPDRLGEGEATHGRRYGPFLAATIAFFLVEMGDKTQIATVALAARYEALSLVVLGTTAGMLLANAPVVLLGHLLGGRLRLDLVRIGAALLFLGLGVWVAAFGL